MVRVCFGSPFSEKVVVHGHYPVTGPLTMNETLNWLTQLPILMQTHSGGDSLDSMKYNPLPPPPPQPPGISVSQSSLVPFQNNSVLNKSTNSCEEHRETNMKETKRS